MRNDSTDTIRLTELFFARDEEALRETARLYEPLCMHIALNILADRQDAEECVNDTWLRAWNHIPPDRPRSIAHLHAGAGLRCAHGRALALGP